MPHDAQEDRLAADDLIRRIDEAVQRANADTEWRERAIAFMEADERRRTREQTFRRLGREEDPKEGREQGMQQSFNQGFVRGFEQGEQYFAALVDKLFDANRIEDIKRAANDSAFRDALFNEFHIA